MTATKPSQKTDLTLRQRWVAAQRLAADDPEVLAAAMAGVTPEALAAVKEERAFEDLVAACRRVRSLSDEEWLARLVDLARQAAERAVIDGKTGTVNLALRAGGALGDLDGNDGEEDPVEALLATLTPEQRAEYDALGRPELEAEREDGDEHGDEDDSDPGRVVPFARRRGPVRDEAW